jgi:hypothetical protein
MLSNRCVSIKVAVEHYLEAVGHPVTFRELLKGVRRGGKWLPTNDEVPSELLRIGVNQYPVRFWRQGNLVGLIGRPKPPLEAPTTFPSSTETPSR